MSAKSTSMLETYWVMPGSAHECWALRERFCNGVESALRARATARNQ